VTWAASDSSRSMTTPRSRAVSEMATRVPNTRTSDCVASHEIWSRPDLTSIANFCLVSNLTFMSKVAEPFSSTRVCQRTVCCLVISRPRHPAAGIRSRIRSDKHCSRVNTLDPDCRTQQVSYRGRLSPTGGLFPALSGPAFSAPTQHVQQASVLGPLLYVLER